MVEGGNFTHIYIAIFEFLVKKNQKSKNMNHGSPLFPTSYSYINVPTL